MTDLNIIHTITAPRGYCQISHPEALPVALWDLTETNEEATASPKICTTTYPNGCCSCGAYDIKWNLIDD